MTDLQHDDQIVLRPIDDLIPYENNPRVHSDVQLDRLVSSIKEFGFTNPVLVDEDLNVIAGHGRLMAARIMGLDEVPTLSLLNLSDDQRRAYIIADNQLALNSSWDDDKLLKELQSLSELGFDLSTLGMDDADMAALTDSWSSDIKDVERHGENLEGIQSKIVVKLDGTYRDEVVEAIRMYCDGHAISAEIS